MNDRIKQLALQANIKYSTRDDAFYSAAFDGVHRPDMERFAESIVQECANLCLTRHHTWRWDDEDDSDSGPRDCARLIKDHFGVE